MRAHVLPDARLAKLAGRFVWLDVNTEDPRNATFLARFPIDAWPTLLVIDPAAEHAVLRWAGTATAAEVESLARDGERALRAERLTAADAALAGAEGLMAERRHAEAAAVFREAIARGGKGWPGRERAADALVQALGFAGDADACVAGAREVVPRLRLGPPLARAVAQGLACALDLDDRAARAAALSALAPAARRAAARPSSPARIGAGPPRRLRPTGEPRRRLPRAREGGGRDRRGGPRPRPRTGTAPRPRARHEG